MNPSCIITECIEHGNLFEYLHSEKTGEIPWILRLKIALDIAKVLGFLNTFVSYSNTHQGCAYLHSLNPPVIHRDLKSPNVLVRIAPPQII